LLIFEEVVSGWGGKRSNTPWSGYPAGGEVYNSNPNCKMAARDDERRVKNNPVILITGETDGLGRATAMLLAESGYRVFALGLTAAPSMET
jgi:hypothetical protein